MLLFLGVDPTSLKAMLFMPGGGLEAGETPAQAVLRETLEETGYRIRLIDAPAPFLCEYPFVWNGILFHCRTWFFRGVLEPTEQTPAPVNDGDYHYGVRWIPVSELDVTFDYSEPIRTAARRLLE